MLRQALETIEVALPCGLVVINGVLENPSLHSLRCPGVDPGGWHGPKYAARRPLVILSGSRQLTAPMTLATSQGHYRTDYTYLSATAILTALPVIAVMPARVGTLHGCDQTSTTCGSGVHRGLHRSFSPWQ